MVIKKSHKNNLHSGMKQLYQQNKRTNYKQKNLIQKYNFNNNNK
jgi:hypothetical protein